MNRTSTLALALALLAGCGNRSGTSALLVKINLDPSLRTTCVYLQVRSMDGTVQAERQLDPAGIADHEMRIALYRDPKFGDQVTVSAEPRYSLDGGCAGTPVLNGTGDQQTGKFPSLGVTEVGLKLGLPLNDGDGDHFTNGLDCKDDDSSINPAADELCMEYVDRNCNLKRGCEDPACGKPNCVEVAHGLGLTSSAAQPKTVGTCVPLTVQTLDANGQLQYVASDTVATVSASLPGKTSSGVTFHSDATCGSAPLATSNVTIGTHGNSANVYFKGTTAGTVVLQADSPGLPSATLQFVLDRADASVLSLSSRSAVTAGDCNALTLQSLDSYGNPSPPTSDTTVTLGVNSANVSFYSDAICSSAAVINTALIPATGTGGMIVIYFKASAPGAFTLSATAPRFAAGNQNVTAVQATPTSLYFATDVQTVTAGVCSSAVTVQLLDAAGNPVTVGSATTVNLSGAPLAFFTDPGCTASAGSSVSIAARTTSATFYFRSIRRGTYPLGASAGSLSNTQNETILPGPPTALDFATNAQSAPAGSCSNSAGVTIRVVDANGNPSPVSSNTPVALASPQGLTFYSNNTCTTQITGSTIAMGSSSFTFYFQGTAPGPATINATATGLTAASQIETIVPGTPSVLTFTGATQNVVASRCSLSSIAVQSRDSLGNLSNVSNNTQVNLSGSAPVSFFTDSNCTTALSQPRVTIPTGASASPPFFFSSPTPGTLTLTGAASGFTDATQTENITPPPPTTLVYNTGPQNLPAGKCSTIVTVQSKDANGDPTSVAVPVTLASNLPGVTFYSDSACTQVLTQPLNIPSGSSTASFYFSGITGGSAGITASSTGLTSVTQTETIVGMVRSGTCTIQGGANSKSCTIGPALSDTTRAVVFYQASNTDTAASSTSVVCTISNATTLVCTRAANGTNAITVNYSVAQFTNPNVIVQHYSVPCTAATTTQNLTTQVNLSETFLLVSSQVNQADAAGQMTRSAQLVGSSGTATSVSIVNSQGCGTNDTTDLQVVTIPGISVVRGLTGAMGGATKTGTVTTPNNQLGDTMLLYSYRTNTTQTVICDRLVRGDITNNTTLTFSRGAGAGGACTGGGGASVDDISFERVQFPQQNYSVQTLQVTMNTGSTSVNQPLSPNVDTTRAVVIAGGQWASGQVHGESAASNLVVGEGRASATLTASNLQLTRTSSSAAAKFTAYVVELVP